MNKCGERSVCCKACHIEEIKKPAGVLCWLYKEGTGCSKYEERPNDCKTYQCIWITQDDIDVKYRPDKLGVVFEQPLGRKYWIGIELVKDALQTEDCKRMVRAMNNDGARVLLKDLNGKHQYSIPPSVSMDDFIQEITT